MTCPEQTNQRPEVDQGLPGERGRTGSDHEHKVPFCGDDNVLKVNSGDGCATAEVLKPQNRVLSVGEITWCELYLHKAVTLFIV